MRPRDFLSTKRGNTDSVVEIVERIWIQAGRALVQTRSKLVYANKSVKILLDSSIPTDEEMTETSSSG